MTPPRLAPLLAQWDFGVENLTATLQGLTDEEYFWEPVPGCWSVRRRADVTTADWHGSGEWVLELDLPDPDPPPFTTIAWRLSHLACWVTLRADYTTGTKAMTWADYAMPASAESARAALSDAAAAWREALTTASDDDLSQVGRSQMPWGLDPTLPFIDIAWWVNKELLHHGAEIALLRDLYRDWPGR